MRTASQKTKKEKQRRSLGLRFSLGLDLEDDRELRRFLLLLKRFDHRDNQKTRESRVNALRIVESDLELGNRGGHSILLECPQRLLSPSVRTVLRVFRSIREINKPFSRTGKSRSPTSSVLKLFQTTRPKRKKRRLTTREEKGLGLGSGLELVLERARGRRNRR